MEEQRINFLIKKFGNKEAKLKCLEIAKIYYEHVHSAKSFYGGMFKSKFEESIDEFLNYIEKGEIK